jgi:hypothetical protein
MLPEKRQAKRSRTRAQPKIANCRKKKKILIPAKTKAPASSSPEIPILTVLSRVPVGGIPTAAVLREVREKWFPSLDADDLRAVYPESKKKVVDTVVKFARKHLVAKGQVYPEGIENPVGTWKATSSGIERAFKEQEGWHARYVEVHSMIEAEETMS